MELDDIDTIAVLGAGAMGHGIAEVAALAGYNVNLRDIKEEFVQSGYEDIEWSLNKLAEKEQISQEDADAALDRVTPIVDMEEAVGDVDFVIEAVPEKMEIKRDVSGRGGRVRPRTRRIRHEHVVALHHRHLGGDRPSGTVLRNAFL